MSKNKLGPQPKPSGPKSKKPFYKRWWFILLVLVILVGAFSGPVEEQTDEELKAEALAKAVEIVETQYTCSRLTIEDNLSYYTPDQIEYAIENCGANWNNKAVKAAEYYFNERDFSYQEVYSQLKFEKFTDEEVEYGIDAAYRGLVMDLLE